MTEFNPASPFHASEGHAVLQMQVADDGFESLPGDAQVVTLGDAQVVTLVDVTGTPVPAQSGSTGVDYSGNKPALPNIGSNFAASGPYASYVLIATVPAGNGCPHIENNSAAQIVIVLDDGTASSGSAPVNAGVIPLSGGSGAGEQGGSTDESFTHFKGRIQVYAPSSSAQVFAARW